jgi:hypothetical protein
MTERTRGSVGVFPEIGIYSGPVPLTSIPRSKSTTILLFLSPANGSHGYALCSAQALIQVRMFLK